jgi:Kef-type K+ transport system membrane component KefB
MSNSSTSRFPTGRICWTNAQWLLLIGRLMLAMGLNLSAIRRLPVTSAIIYLAVGVLVGPTVFGLFHFNPSKNPHCSRR